MLQPGQELSPEEVVAMKRDEEATRLSTLMATPMGKTMFSDGPEYTPEEVVTMQAAEAQAEIPAEQVLVQQVLELNDPNAPDQPKDEWRRRTQLKKALQDQGLLDSDFMSTAKGIGGLVTTIADGVTSPLRYDPRDENGNVIPAQNALEYISRYNPATWPEAQADAALRLPATLNYAGELLEQGYGIMNDGLAGLGGPRYKIKETGDFITEMDRAMYRSKVAQTGGLAGDPGDDALIKQYADQGMTLVPVTPEDVEEFEYRQHLRFRERLKSMEQKRTEAVGPEVLTASAMSLSAAPLDWLTGSNYMDQVWGKKLPAESQAMALQMGADPMMWTSFGAGLTRLGISTAAKGGGARILDAIGKGAQRMARPTEQSLREVQRFQNAVWSKGRVALYAGGLAGMNYSSLPEPLKNAMNVAASAYVIHKGGAGTLRWVGDKFPQAAIMLREAADPLNGADIMARQAIAKNAKIPASIRERVANPSQFVSMESTPARLARNEALSPKTRKMMERLSNFYVVQGVRGASAVATGATKGAIAATPFAELTRAGGDEEGANMIYGAGTALGGAGGAAGRVLGARNRTAARTESDIGRMLVDIQGTVPELQRQGAVKRNQWFDRELNRFLTDVELAGGDIAHMFQTRSFDEIARTAAMQGLFRNVDYVPLNDADFALNAKAHGQSGAAGFYLHNPDGARPRLFVNLDARRADVDAHEFGEAFFSSDAFSPEQKAAMRAEVDARYGPEGVTARAREYASQMIKAENARNFPNETLVISEDQIRAKMDELSQDELGRGGQDPMDWARREIMVEEWRMAGTDYARLRRGVPAGANPVTFIENILGANARALGLSGVRIDPETGQAVTPSQLFKENPVAADDPIVNRNLRAYIKTYNAWLNDPSQEVPSGVKVARDGNVQSLANNPNVDFYSSKPDDPTAPKENTFGVLGPDGRVVEKSPKQRRDERKARNSQVKNMVGRNLLAPGDAAFGLKRWADGRVRAGGRRLPQSIILQNHWKPWLPIINTLESMADSGESVQVRYFAVGNSADKVKTAKLKDVDAINREMVFDQWTTNKDGDLLAQFLDLTAMRNRAMRAISERNPALDPANGGPGYSLQAIMDDVNQWMADKRAGKDGAATIGPDRKNIVNALINPGTTLNRGKNPLAGSMGKGSAIKTLLLEGINAVSGTGRKGAAMDYNWANGNFMPDQPPPRPDVDIDLPQERMPQQIPREAQGMPDAPRRVKMTKAAILNAETGRIYTGPSHPQIYDALPRDAFVGVPDDADASFFMGDGWNSPEGLIDGFVDADGKFYDREDAARAVGSSEPFESVTGLQQQGAMNNPQASPPAARRGQAMPDSLESVPTDQLLRQYEENQGYLGLSTLGMREGRPVAGGAAQTRELLRRNEAITAELERRGVRQEDPQLQRALQRRGQAMPDAAPAEVRQDGTVVAPEDAPTFTLPRRAMAQFMPDAGINLEDYADRPIVALPADRMGIGQMRVGPKGAEQILSVPGQGGAGFMEIYNGGGWAFTDTATADRFLGRLREVARPGDTSVIVGITALNEVNHLKNQTGQLAYVEALEAAIKNKSISRKQADAHIREIAKRIYTSEAQPKDLAQSTRDKFKAMRSFDDFQKAVRAKSLNFADAAWLLDKMQQRTLPVPYKEARDIGIAFDDVARQTADPRYADVPFGTVVALLEVPINQAPSKNPFHYAYPAKVEGNRIGFLSKFQNIDDLTSDPRIRNKQGRVTAQPLQTVLPVMDRVGQPVRRGQAMPDAIPQDAPPFYMKSAQVLDSKIQGKAATVDQVRAILTNPQNGIKAEELKWTGVLQAAERLAKENNGKVPKEALLQYLADDGAVRLEEVTMGGVRKQWTQADIDALLRQAQRTRDFSEYERAVLEYEDQQLGSNANDTGNQTLFARYQEPGGENYREVNLVMPAIDEWEGFPQAHRYSDGTEDFKRIAHMRINDRTDAQGRPGLFLEEIQSDRHQTGRQKGYAGDPSGEQRKYDFAKRFYFEVWRPVQLGEITRPEAQKRWDAIGAEAAKEGISKNDIQDTGARYGDFTATPDAAIPDAPFRKDWPVQMFKRALADAVSSGKEWIGWTTGETQAARYDLSKQVKSIDVIEHHSGQGRFVDIRGKDGESVMSMRYNDKGIAEDGKPLSDYIGKELADKVMSLPQGQREGSSFLVKRFSGVDLKVGGEGMKGFYDQILPKEISKYVKQWGGQVEKARIGQPKKHSGKLTRDELAEAKRDAKALINGDIDVAEFNDNWGTALRDEDVPGSDPYRINEAATDLVAAVRKARELDAGGTFEAWRVNITPQMRESIKKAGQALFVGGMAAVVAEQEEQ